MKKIIIILLCLLGLIFVILGIVIIFPKKNKIGNIEVESIKQVDVDIPISYSGDIEKKNK